MQRSSMKWPATVFVLVMLASCGGGDGGDTGGGSGSGGGGGATSALWLTRRVGYAYPINAVARSAGMFVAITQNGRATTSADGYTWTVPADMGQFTYNDIVWGNGLFVAAGDWATIATSADGVSWTGGSLCDYLCTDDLLSIAWSGSRFVAVGEGGVIYTSAAGAIWSASTTTFSSFSKFRGVATDSSRFVAAGWDGDTVKGMIVYSDDGMVWSRATVTPETGYEYDRVVWDGSRFLATAWGYDGGVWTSATGTSWTRLSTNLVSELTPTGGGYVGTNGVGGVKTSADADTWTAQYDFVYYGINDILWMPDRNEYLVAGGLPATNGFIATSTDLTTWEARSTSADMTSVLWNGTQFIALDQDGRLFTSTDGTNWGSDRMIEPDGILRTYRDIVWNGSRYVAVTYEKIVSSDDGITWGNPYDWSLGSFVSSVWTGTQFAAITSDGKFFFSPDGISWPAAPDVVTIGTNLTDLAWGNGAGYVATSSTGTVYTSPTGSVWTARPGAASTALQAVAWDGSQFVAVGNSGTIATSPNGSAWTSHSIAGGPSFTDVSWTGSEFIAISSSGKVYVSPNGTTWTQETTDTTGGLTKVAASPSKAVIVGKQGRILSR
jgi:hypothetical protein